MKTNLLFGIHCHQPIDNFDEVVYDAIAKSYKPFFETLKLFPNAKCSVHFSGWLLEFIQKNDEELFILMQSLKEQIEFFSGGYYEPILASIPSEDRIAQIKKLNNFLQTNFGQSPSGLWLTERVWDDTIITDLVHCGIKYVIVDDYHLIANGTTSDLQGYYLTENNSQKIAVFPISKELRYAIPFCDINTIDEKLKSFANSEGKNGAIIFDDGEKFGIWPNTYDLCYEKGWLKDFFELCTANSHIKTQTYKEFFESNKPLGLVYLPTVSYEEMGHWSNLDESNHNSKGGIWKNFFIKYSESNHIHKRILELSKNKVDNAIYLDCLHKAQCNDVLWHGVFGGIYLPNLRDNAYRYIIECEKMQPLVPLKIEDIDFDGYDDFKLSSKSLMVITSPKNGAAITEFDIKDKNFNLLNTLTRRDESYHQKIQITEHAQTEQISTIHDNVLTLDKNTQIFIDRYKKYSSIDHICNDSFNIENFKSNTFESFSKIYNGIFSNTNTDEASFILDFEISKEKSSIKKEYKLNENKLSTNISLQTQSNEKLKYINEWNLHFAIYDILLINGKKFEDEITINTTDKLTIFDPYLQKTIDFNFSNQIDIFICKNYTVSQSEAGLDLTVQQLSFAFICDFVQNLDFQFTITIQE